MLSEEGDRESSNLNGLINLLKPSGLTSRAAIDFVARAFKPIKVGHAGTLDPLASGVLVVCVGSATRLIANVQSMEKVYRTTIRLGARSDTLDADGRIVETDAPPIPTESAVRAAVAAQVGEIAQTPPQYSALKVAGRRSYELARKGQAITLAPRTVRIDRIVLVRYEWPWLDLEIQCGAGTYIRAIARDVGDALGCGGLVHILTRTAIGPFRIEDAIDPVGKTRREFVDQLLPPHTALPHVPRLNVSDDDARAIAHGRAIRDAEAPRGELALFASGGRLIALAFADETGLISPWRVFTGGESA